MPTSKREKRKIKGGYSWNILWVDLDHGEAKPLEFDEAFALRYIGGRGFGAKLVWDQLQKGTIDPLGPRKSPGDFSRTSGGSLPSRLGENVLRLHLSGNRNLW